MKKLILIGLLLTPACGGGLTLDPPLGGECMASRWASLPIAVIANSPEDLAVMDAYNDVFGAEVFVNSGDGVPLLLRDSIQDNERVRGEMSGDCSDGLFNQASIQILETLDANTYSLVLAHELGHLLGIDRLNTGITRSPVDTNESLMGLLTDPAFLDAVAAKYPEI